MEAKATAMKANKYFSEDKPIISLQRARELLPETKMTDEELQDVLLNIQQFSEMVYDIYLMQQKASEKLNETQQGEHYAIAA